jgi:asparagine synthase (glutamine-hydrolysing)
VDYRLAEIVIGLRKATSDLPLGHKGWLKAALQDLVPPFVFQRPKRGFTPPWRQWTRALMAQYGADMLDGTLVDRGIIRRRAAERFRAGFDGLGRPMPLAFPSLVLEQWARGMILLERSANDSRTRRHGEPNLSGSRDLTMHA